MTCYVADGSGRRLPGRDDKNFTFGGIDCQSIFCGETLYKGGLEVERSEVARDSSYVICMGKGTGVESRHEGSQAVALQFS